MRRRGFFAAVAAVLAAPKAVKLLPVAPRGPFFGIDRSIKPTGLTGWLPGPDFPLNGDDFVMRAFPLTPAGRLIAAAELYEDGTITRDTFVELSSAAEWEPPYDA